MTGVGHEDTAAGKRTDMMLAPRWDGVVETPRSRVQRPADFPVLHELPEVPRGAHVAHVVAQRQRPAAASRGIGHLQRFCQVHGHGLLAQDMSAGVEGADDDLTMRDRHGDDADKVEGSGVEQVCVVRVRRGTEPIASGCSADRVLVADGCDLDAVDAFVGLEVERPLAPTADDRDSHQLGVIGSWTLRPLRADSATASVTATLRTPSAAEALGPASPWMPRANASISSVYRSV